MQDSCDLDRQHWGSVAPEVRLLWLPLPQNSPTLQIPPSEPRWILSVQSPKVLLSENSCPSCQPPLPSGCGCSARRLPAGLCRQWGQICGDGLSSFPLAPDFICSLLRVGGDVSTGHRLILIAMWKLSMVTTPSASSTAWLGIQDTMGSDVYGPLTQDQIRICPIVFCSQLWVVKNPWSSRDSNAKHAWKAVSWHL